MKNKEALNLMFAIQSISEEKIQSINFAMAMISVMDTMAKFAQQQRKVVMQMVGLKEGEQPTTEQQIEINRIEEEIGEKEFEPKLPTVKRQDLPRGLNLKVYSALSLILEKEEGE